MNKNNFVMAGVGHRSKRLSAKNMFFDGSVSL